MNARISKPTALKALMAMAAVACAACSSDSDDSGRERSMQDAALEDSAADDGSAPADEPPDALQTFEGELRQVVISDPQAGSSGFDFFLEMPNGDWIELDVPSVDETYVNRTVRVTGELLANGAIRVTDIQLVG